MDPTDFSVNATHIDQPDNIRYLNVLSVDTDAKTIRVMFGGARTGMYQVTIRHKNYGLLDTTGMVLDVSSKVTEISPNTGSINGGTLVTITGTNFGTEKTDNPVQISTHGGVGSIDCFVQTIEPTQITCRVDTEMVPKADATEADLVVFLKTSEEAQCPDEKCKWTYTATLPVVTEVTTEFNTDTNKWQVKVVGTGLRDSAESGDMSDLQINGVSQEVDSHTDVMAVFNIIDLKDLESLDVNLFFPVGIPEGHDIVRQGINVTPKLLQVTPSHGTQASTLIQVTAPGVGTETTGLELVKNGASICSSLEIVEYGLLNCWTKSEDYGEEAFDL